MDLEELRAFLAVVETGSFLTAARKLRLSRATLRRRVDDLEVRAGVPLLERTRLGAGPTPAGAVLATRGQLIMQEVGALLDSIREVGGEPTGLVRAVLPVGLPPQMVTLLLTYLHSRYPRLAARIRYSDDPVGGLLEDVDIAAHFGLESPDGPWTSREVLRMRVWLLASSDYLQRHGTPRSIEELHQHTLLSWEIPGEDGQLWATLQGARFKVAPTLLAADVHMLRHCAIAGLGIAYIPDALLPDPGLPLGTLVPVLPDVVGCQVALRVVIPNALAEIPKIKVLLDLIRAFIGEAVST